MKKIVFMLIVIILISIISLPFFGNKVIELVLKDRVEVLNSYGLEIKNTKTDSSYLTSQKNYSIYIKDGDKFLEYINQFSNTQIPIYLSDAIEDTELEVIVEYSNLAFSDGISMEIYPLKLSKKIMKTIQRSDIEFANHFSDFLINKGFLYHLNYNILSENFDGYIKNIEESYTLASGDKIDIIFKGATFNGKGLLLAPKKLDSKISKIFFKFDGDSGKFNILFSDISESLVFKSKRNYSIESKIKHISIEAQAQDFNKSKVTLDNIYFDFSIDTMNAKVDLSTRATFDKLSAQTPQATFDLNNFKHDISLAKLDKHTLEVILELIEQSKINQTSQMKEDIAQNMKILLSKGVELKILDLSLAKIIINKIDDLGGASLKADFVLLPNSDLVNKKLDEIDLIREMNIEILFQISNKMFEIIKQTQPILAMVQDFAKEKKNNMIFDIKVKDANITVNDRVIQ